MRELESNPDYDSFYSYLVEKGYYFDKEIIEDFLLSIKINPFIMLFGGVGIGKTKLPILFSEYLSYNSKKEDIIINATNSLGKSPSNKEWHLKRDSLSNILPILPFENRECTFTINDSFNSVGKFKLDPRFRFNDKQLIKYLIELQDENPIQDLNLKIKVGERITNSYYRYIYDIRNEIDDKNLFSAQLSKNHIVNDFNEYNLEFLIFEKINNDIEDYFLQLFDLIVEPNGDRDVNQICIMNCNRDDLDKNFSSKFIDTITIIELDNLNLSKYFSLDSSDLYTFADLEYLEFNLVDTEVINFKISDFRNIFKNILSEDNNLWDELCQELNLFYKIFNKMHIPIGFRVINEILKFMVVSWKYEGKPVNWINWRRYFDSQIKQKLLPKINGSYDIEDIEGLANICGSKLNNSENFVKYPLSFLKLNNMINISNDDNFSFYKSFNFKTIDRGEYYNSIEFSESVNSHVEDVGVNDDVDLSEEESGVGGSSVFVEDVGVNDDVDLSEEESGVGGSSVFVEDVGVNDDVDLSEEESNKVNYDEYIYKNEGTFIVNNVVNNEYKTFGCYDSFIDAKLIIDTLIEVNWNLDDLDKNKNIYTGSGFYYILEANNGKLNILKRFDSYSSAKNYVEELYSSDEAISGIEVKPMLNFGDYKIDLENNLYVLKRNNNQRKWGYFISIEDAIIVGDLLVKYDWDLKKFGYYNEIYFEYDIYWIIKVLRSVVFVLGRFESYEEAKQNVRSLTNNFSLSVLRNYSENDLSKYGDHIIKRYKVFSVINNGVNYGDFDSLNDAVIIKSLLIKHDWNLNLIGNEIVFLFEGYYYCILFSNEKFIILDSFDNEEDAKNFFNFADSEDFFFDDVRSLAEIRDEIDDLHGWEKLVFKSINEFESNKFSLQDLKKLDIFEVYQFKDNSLESLIEKNLKILSNKGILKELGNGYFIKMV